MKKLLSIITFALMLVAFNQAVAAEKKSCQIYLELEKKGQFRLPLGPGGKYGEKWWEMRDYQSGPGLISSLFGERLFKFNYHQMRDVEIQILSDDIMDHSSQMALGFTTSTEQASLVMFVGPLKVTDQFIPKSIGKAIKKDLMSASYPLEPGVYVVLDADVANLHETLKIRSWKEKIVKLESMKPDLIDQFLELVRDLTGFSIDRVHPLSSVPLLKAAFFQASEVFVYDKESLQEIIQSRDHLTKSKFWHEITSHESKNRQ